MKTELEKLFETLQETHENSKPLMNALAANHEDAIDFLRALRFLLKSNPGAELFVSGIESLIVHQENLRCVAMSYHTAVGNIMKTEESMKAKPV